MMPTDNEQKMAMIMHNQQESARALQETAHNVKTIVDAIIGTFDKPGLKTFVEQHHQQLIDLKTANLPARTEKLEKTTDDLVSAANDTKGHKWQVVMAIVQAAIAFAAGLMGSQYGISQNRPH